MITHAVSVRREPVITGAPASNGANPPKRLPFGAITRVALAMLAWGWVGTIQAQVLIKEIVSREVSVEVGGVQTPAIKDVVSREVAMLIQSGTEQPYAQLVSREVSLTVASGEAPPPVTGFLITLSPTGDSVALDWTSYNPWAVKDIDHFDIYIADHPFTDVTSLSPVKTVGAETVTATIDGLTAARDHYISIVAVDALGNSITAVVNSAAYIISPQVISREVSVFIGGEPVPPYAQVISREVSLAVASDTVPPQVTGYSVVSSATGDTATLDWTSYNPWAVKTVGHFDIYVSDSPFTDVTGMTPIQTVGGETVSTTVEDLTPLRDHYFAIVAVDVLGNRNTAVINSAAYIISPQVISREVSLFVGGEPEPPYKEVVSREVSIIVPDTTVPDPVTGPGGGFTALTSTTRYRAIDLDWTAFNELLQRDIVRYRVYIDTVFFTDVTGMTPHSFIPAGTQLTTAIVPVGNQIYYSAVVAEDVLGNFNPAVISVSAQSSVSDLWVPDASSITYNSIVLPNGGTIRAAGTFQVDATVAPAIVRVDFSFRPSGGTDTLLLSDTTPGGGFTAPWDAGAYPDGPYVFTFRAYDNVGRFTELTRNVTLHFNHPPLITAMTLDAAALANDATIAHSGLLGATATDSDGIGSAEFFYQLLGAPDRTSLGTDATPANGLSASFAIEPIADGDYDLIVRVYDALGTFSETTRRVTVQLAPPAAPALTSPADGSRVNSATLAVTGTASIGSQVFLLLEGVDLSGPLTPDAAGAFSGSVTLQPGNNTLTARASNRAGSGPQSTPRTVSLNAGPVIATLKYDGVTLADGALIARPGRVGVVATDSDGLNRAEFFFKPPLSALPTQIGTDTIPTDGLYALWQVQDLPDGTFDLIARVYDSLGAVSEITRSVNLVLAAPAAPAITSPLDNPTVMAPDVEVRGTAPLGATLKLYRNSAEIYSGAPAADGSFTIQVPLVDGANSIYAQSSHRAGPSPSSNTITVTKMPDNPVLTLTLPQSAIPEGGSLSGIVSMDRTIATDTTVSLGVSEANRLTFPASIVIPSGQLSAPFTVNATQNSNVEPQVSLMLIASAPNTTAGTFTLGITDDDTPAIQFALDRSTVSENAGPSVVIGTLTLNRTVGNVLTATFTVSTPGQLALPASVTVPANTLSVPVAISPVNNTLVDGIRTVAITANLAGPGGGTIASAAPVDLMITDDEGITLTLAADRDLFLEGRNPAGSIIVSRNGQVAEPLLVQLVSANPTKLIVPATVTIPAGQSSTTFPIQTVDDGVPQGNQSIALDATATDYNPASAVLIVTDSTQPDLAIALLDPPTGAETDAWIDVRILMTNQGAGDAPGPFAQRLLLSSDDVIGNDLLLGQADFTGLLPAGASIEQSLRVRLPRTAGRFWLVAQTDAAGTLDEALEDNNATIAAIPLEIAPAYSATLAIAPETLPTNTPVPIIGSAKLQAGTPARFMLVNIHISNGGIQRTISALTNSLGQFSTTFTPLPGEGGLFQFVAAHPGSPPGATQDEVRVYGLRAEPSAVDLTLAESTSQTSSLTLRNLTDLPVSGLAATVTGLPAGIQFIPTLAATTLAPSGTVALDYQISSQAPLDRTTFTMTLNSTEGASLSVPVAVTVVGNTPKLVSDPPQLAAGMLRGGQQLVNFTLRNDGKAATGPINLRLPSGASWITTTTTLPISPLAPGQSAPIMVLLTPPADLALGDYPGSFFATDGTYSLSIPFTFRALSDQMGQLVVRAEDEFTYYAAGNPPLAGASVTLTDALTRETIATLLTDATGRADFGQLREGYYEIGVTADRHARYLGKHLIKPGITNEILAFLSREAVTYTWTVEPVEIEDRYKITVDATFETNVPIPVVTLDPPQVDIDDLVFTDGFAEKSYVVTNHGLIAAQNAAFIPPDIDGFIVKPLVEQLGTLPAKSSVTVPVAFWQALPVDHYFTPVDGAVSEVTVTPGALSTGIEVPGRSDLRLTASSRPETPQNIVLSIQNISQIRSLLPVLRFTTGQPMLLIDRGTAINGKPVLFCHRGIPALEPDQIATIEIVLPSPSFPADIEVRQVGLSSSKSAKEAAFSFLSTPLTTIPGEQEVWSRLDDLFADTATFIAANPGLRIFANEGDPIVGDDFMRILTAYQIDPPPPSPDIEDEFNEWLELHPLPEINGFSALGRESRSTPPQSSSSYPPIFNEECPNCDCDLGKRLHDMEISDDELNDIEDYLQYFFVHFYRLNFGVDATAAWLEYLDGNCDVHHAKVYADGDEVVEGIPQASGFKNHRHTKQLVEEVMDDVKDIVQDLVDRGEIGCSPVEYDLRVLVEEIGGRRGADGRGYLNNKARSILAFDDDRGRWFSRLSLSIPGNMAGGVGYHRPNGPLSNNCVEDDRSISGRVRVIPNPAPTCERGVKYIIEPVNFKIEVKDALDFLPGGIGFDGIREVTTRLRLLEAKCRTGAVPFTVTYHPPVKERRAFNPKLQCIPGCCLDFLILKYSYVCGDQIIERLAPSLVKRGSCVSGGSPPSGGGTSPPSTPGAAISTPIHYESVSCTSQAQAATKAIAAGGSATPKEIQASPAPADEGVCARVRIRLEQEAVIARDGFRATLEVTNRDALPLENVRVDIAIRPEEGGFANDLFGIQYQGASGLSAVDGTGTIAGNGVGTARWLITPTVDTAPTDPKQFFVSGTLSYKVNGLQITIPLSEVPITVLPSPRLSLKYFHQRDVFSDDPFTTPIEPSIPYSLAVMVQNNGAGIAKNFRVTSAQPNIIENEKGLLADFQIIATQVAGQPLQPSLTASFGDVGPGQITIGEWLMTSSLQGLFIDYSAIFEHVDVLNNPRLSLIDSVEIHEMNHQVRALGAFDDGLPDFLVNDEPDLRDLPDTIHLSDGSTAPVAVVEQAQAAGTLTKTLTATISAGWTYLRVPEPSSGQLELVSVVRSDGLVIPLDVNAWVTDRTFIGQGQRPVYENILHLLDHGTTGSYTLTYQAKLGPDVTFPSSQVKALPAQSPIEFPVTWEGSDDRRVAFYDVYVSTDGGPSTLWLQRSQETGAIFQGELGRTYAFHSQATDGAGNQETAPSTADATTTVSLSNLAPTLAAITGQQVTEGETFVLDLAGEDPDGRSDLLSYAFSSIVPPGLTIDNRTGLIRWVTGESDGGRQVPVDVKVTDTGYLAQSVTRSFAITVLEQNQPPVLDEVPPQRVAANGTLKVQLNAQDADLPVETLTYRFTTPPPSGMSLDENTGLISWQPTTSQANQTLAVSVAVTDSGTPPKEAQRTFPVTVDPALVDRLPVFLAAPLQLWLEGTTRSLSVEAFDPDGDAVTMALDNAGLPGNLSFSSTPGTGRGVITWNTTGVPRGIYLLPITATAAQASSSYSPTVKIVPNNLYWTWAIESLNNLTEPSMSDPSSDPDGDKTANIFEWALMRNALVADQTQMDFSLQSYEGGWRSADLNFHRRRGSNQYVTLRPQQSTLMDLWNDVPTTGWESSFDPFGDRDNNPDTEEVLFRIWLSPEENAKSKFFRMKSSTRPVSP